MNAVKGRPMLSALTTNRGNGVMPAAGNLMLAYLPPEEMDRLRPSLQTVDLPQGQVLYDAQMPIDQVYFMDQGMISVVSIMRNGDSIEVGTIGNEGLAGLPSLLGVSAVPYRHIVQVGGKARRTSVETVLAELKPGRLLPQLLNRYH